MDMCVSWLCRYSLHVKKYLTHLIQHATQPFVEVMIILCLCNAMPSEWMHSQTLTGGPENCQCLICQKGMGYPTLMLTGLYFVHKCLPSKILSDLHLLNSCSIFLKAECLLKASFSITSHNNTSQAT